MKSAVFPSIREKSKRLPQKTLLGIRCNPMTVHRIDWLKTARRPDRRILCSSVHPDNNVLADITRREMKSLPSVIVNTGATVGHASVVGDGVDIAPGAHLAGAIRIGRGTLVGVEASVIPGIRIGAEAVVGAGAVVIRDVPDGATVFGNHARATTSTPEK